MSAWSSYVWNKWIKNNIRTTYADKQYTTQRTKQILKNELLTLIFQ